MFYALFVKNFIITFPVTLAQKNIDHIIESVNKIKRLGFRISIESELNKLIDQYDVKVSQINE